MIRECDHCEKTFSSKSGYYYHITRCSGVAPSNAATDSSQFPAIPPTTKKCPHCENSYSNQGNLTKHMKKCEKKHIAERDEKFNRMRGDLKNQMRELTLRYRQVEDDYTDQIDVLKENYEVRIKEYKETISQKEKLVEEKNQKIERLLMLLGEHKGDKQLNIQNNITINTAFGREDFSNILDRVEFVKGCLMSGASIGSSLLLKEIYEDPKNKGILKVTDIARNICKVYNGQEMERKSFHYVESTMLSYTLNSFYAACLMDERYQDHEDFVMLSMAALAERSVQKETVRKTLSFF